MNIIPPSISPEDFAMICFICLMQNGDGFLDKAPSYIKEKKDMLTSGYDAFSYLDIHNMGRVIRYCKMWKVNIPLVVKGEWDMQQAAMIGRY